ncbi:DUF1672 family protein [Fictibacillus aquaticus]|uniref:DUF1672 domain-containing protein n=1 Tax=Fictibacillus aquaticus TaxID=2021314 RepID=A0A235F939_9BACL|nr:DUF1672 family protein [Fictibacillus aquaticus]OYD57689.1 hypothetical protein CGZ90_13580 [Fictibacillus aquaticus]
MLNTNKLGMITAPLLGIMLLGGCMKGETETVKKEANPLVSVQEYTGQGYKLPNGDKNDKIAEANRDKILPAMEKFFLDKYKTNVEVHNIVGNKHGATVFVESKGEPHFNTFAIIPIDNKENVRPDGIWTEEGQVEFSIKSGLYAMIYEEQLKTLDMYLEKLTKEQPVIGVQAEAIQNTKSTGYTTPYYFITVPSDSFDPLYKTYLEKPETTKAEYQAAVKTITPDPELYNIIINLYMKDKNQKPDQTLFDQIVADLEKMNLPPGLHTVSLHENSIDIDSPNESKDNSLEREIQKY